MKEGTLQVQTPSLLVTVLFQSLQNKSYNHFAAIYYLLVERLKAHRCSFPVEQRLDARQRRPSTIAEQTVIKVTVPRPGQQEGLLNNAC